MIDLHTHLLPGVDDGARSLEVAVRVLERFASEGVAAVACTPHLRASEVDAAPVEAHARLRAALRAAVPGGPVLHGGFEVMLDRPGVPLDRPGIRLGASRAVLVEFPHAGVPPGATHELARLRADGLVPVLAHPERYPGFSTRAAREWRAAGVVLQGDALTLLSTGPVAAMGRALLGAGLYDVLASDNHGDRRGLAAVRAWLVANGGHAQAARLLEENPRRVLAGEAVLPVPPFVRADGLWARLRAMVGGRRWTT